LKRKNAYWDIWRSIRCGAAKKGGAAVNALSLAIYGAWPARSGHFFHGAKNPRNRHPEGVRRYGAPYCIDAMQRCCPVDPDRLDDRLAAGLVFYAWLAAKFCLSDDDQRLDVYCGGTAAIGIALLTVGFQSRRAAMANPVKSLRTE